MSPCINICALGADGHCTGCLRTRDEIGNWMRMTPAEQRALIDTLDERRAQRTRRMQT